MENNENNQDDQFIRIKDLTKLIKASDNRATIKWCQDQNIPIITCGHTKVIEKFLFQAILDTQIIKSLKASYPNNWHDIFICYLNKDRYGYAMSYTSIDKTISDFKETAEACRYKKPISKYAKAFAKD